MANFIISTGQPIGAGAYQPKIEEVSYEPNGTITDLTPGVIFKIAFGIPDGVDFFNFKDNGVETMGSLVNGEWVFIDHFDVSYVPNGVITGIMPLAVTFDSVKNEFVVPLGIISFTFDDNSVATIGSLVNGEWVFIDHFDVGYEPNGAITNIAPPNVTFDSVKNEFVVPIGIISFTFDDNGVVTIGSLVNGEWVFIDHFDVSYEPNGVITDILPPSVTFDGAKNEFVVPAGIPTFTFTDNGVAMRGLFVNSEWVFVDHFDVSYEPNGAITAIAPPSVTFDSVKNEFIVPVDVPTFTFTDNGVVTRGSLVNGEWVFIDHFDVSYVPNGAITNITAGVTFDSVKNEFIVPVNIPTFTFDDNGVAMRGSLVDGEWVFALQ